MEVNVRHSAQKEMGSYEQTDKMRVDRHWKLMARRRLKKRSKRRNMRRKSRKR